MVVKVADQRLTFYMAIYKNTFLILAVEIGAVMTDSAKTQSEIMQRDGYNILSDDKTDFYNKITSIVLYDHGSFNLMGGREARPLRIV